MAADCTGVASEPALTGEPHDLKVASWPVMLAVAAERAAFAEQAALKRQAKRPVFPSFASDAYAAAVDAALAAYDAETTHSVAHCVAEKFQDDNVLVLEEAWLDKRNEYKGALEKLLSLPSDTPDFSILKVNAFLAGYGCSITPEGDIKGLPDVDVEREVAFGQLYRDILGLLVSAPKKDAQGADLTDRYEQLCAEFNALPVDVPKEVDEQAYQSILKMDDDIATRDCLTAEDARAKVAHAIRGLEDGERGTEIAALKQVMAFLEDDLVIAPKEEPTESSIPIEQLEEQFVGTLNYYLHLPIPDDPVGEELAIDAIETHSATAMELGDKIMAAPCDSPVAARAKLKVAQNRLERDGGSNWGDEADLVAIRQAIGFLDTLTEKPGPALIPEKLGA